MILRSEDFVITTWVGEASRKVVWHGSEPIDLDLPRGWILERVGGKLRVRNSSIDHPAKQIQDALEFNMPEPGSRTLIELPSPPYRGMKRPLDVEILRMKPLDPVYLLRHQMAPNYPSAAPKQLMQFYGERYYLVRYRPVPDSRMVSDDSREIFKYTKIATGYSIAARSNVRVKTATENFVIPVGKRCDLNEQEFFSATFISGVHWWRFRMVPTPDSAPPVETEETEEDFSEELRFKLSALSFLIVFIVLLGAMFSKSRREKPAPKILAQIEIKQPKIIPPSKLTPPPPPPPEPPPPPPEPPKQVVELKEPKPEPIAKKKPIKPKKVAKAPTPKKVVEAPKKTVEVVRKLPDPPKKTVEKVAPPEPPASVANAAAQKAAETAAMKQQLLKKLGFISTSSKRAAADPQVYEQKEGRFTNTPTVGGDVSKSTTLDKLVKDAPGDGNIRTNSSRTVSSQVNFGSRKGKGLNDVQGKVSLGELQGDASHVGDALGGSGGLSVFGTGQVSEGEIEKALAKYLQRFQFCYEKALLADTGLGGKVTIQWTITASGTAQTPKIVSSQMNNADLHGCISKVIREIPFPRPKGGTVQVKKTFAFSSSQI